MQRVRIQYPGIAVMTSRDDPAEHDLIVNATQMGTKAGDPLPIDVTRISPEAFVGEVVTKQEITAFLQAATDRGCSSQVGTDML